MSHAIIVRGHPVRCDADVRVLLGTSHEFVARPVIAAVEVVTWHWTGGTRDAYGVIDTLRGKSPPLSINFILGRSGVVWQCCDAAKATAHAGGPYAVLSSNPRGPGVEVCGRPNGDQWWTDAQAVAGRALADALSRAFGLPLDAPRHADGSVFERTMHRRGLAGFRGHIGHYHVAGNKRDPGPAWLEEICRRSQAAAVCTRAGRRDVWPA